MNAGVERSEVIALARQLGVRAYLAACGGVLVLDGARWWIVELGKFRAMGRRAPNG